MKKFFFHIIFYLNFLAVILLLLSYLSVYISPERYWIFAFFGLAYPFLLVINIFFVLYWIAKRRKEFLWSFLTILLGWNLIISFVQLPFHRKQEKIENDSTFKMLSYNVRLFNLYGWSKATEKTDYMRFIKKQRPAVICFQEFYTTESGHFKTKDLMYSLRHTPYSHIVSTYHTKSSLYGIATFSAFPIVNKGCIRFFNTNNICIYTDIKVKDDTIRIYNNHLQSIHLTKKHYDLIDSLKVENDARQNRGIREIYSRMKKAYIKRAQQVDIIADQIRHSPYPVIVCGDFNDTPVSYTYKTMRGSLEDAFITSGRGLGNTYNGHLPSFRIDYFFNDRKLRSFGYKRIKVKMSDHYPILCDFKIY